MSLGLFVALVVVGTTIWVGIDASKRDWQGKSGTATWVAGCILLWIVVFPIYLAKRNKAPLKAEPVVVASEDGNAYGLPRERLYRECPHCKEPMRRDAGYCPHCRQPSNAWRFYEGRWWLRETDNGPWEWLDERTNEWVTLETAAAEESP